MGIPIGKTESKSHYWRAFGFLQACRGFRQSALTQVLIDSGLDVAQFGAGRHFAFELHFLVQPRFQRFAVALSAAQPGQSFQVLRQAFAGSSRSMGNNVPKATALHLLGRLVR